MRRFMIVCAAAFVVGVVTPYTVGQPVPIWSNRLDDLASATADEGTVVNPPASFTAGFDGDAFAGNGSAYIAWNNTAVANIFDAAWDNSLGSTIDLFFSGSHWDTHTGDSGFWSVVDRSGGYDGHLIVSVRDGKLRFPYRDSYTNYNSTHHLTSVPLANDTVYRLTVRQANGTIEVYLDGGAYSNTTPVYTGVHSGSCSFPAPNTGTGTSGREMNVGNRSRFFGGTLKSGEWVDYVRVFNGYYTPAEIPLPAQGLPVAIATADVFAGFAPLTVQFDGSASYDTGAGSIVSYQWDFNSDDIIDDSSGPVVSHEYAAAGNYVCKLTVTDNENNTAVDVVPIQVYAAAPAGLLMITAVEPAGTMPAGSYTLTSVTAQRQGSDVSYTATDLVGPPDGTYVQVTGDVSGGGAGAATAADAFAGLELGSTVSGLNLDGEYLAGYFADEFSIRPDGTPAPEIFVIESSNTSDKFQIQLLTNGPGDADVAVAATIQVRDIDYAGVGTVIGSTSRGGVAIDLDAIGATNVRGVRLTGADGFGGESGVDPVLVAAVPVRCNTPAVDTDGDGTVDLEDFARLQRCITGADDPASAFDAVSCYCFDRDKDRDIDEYDLNEFAKCATGPAIPWSAELAPNCIP